LSYKKGKKNCVGLNVSASVQECDSIPVSPVCSPGGETILRVPVTLAELVVRTNLEAKISFPEPVLEIKDVKKRVEIEQCRLLLTGVPAGTDPFTPTDLQLFIRGHVRKNIQYATPHVIPGNFRCASKCVSSAIRSLTAKVPFECVTTISAEDFLTPPQLPNFNSRAEFDFFRAKELGKGFPEKDKHLSSDLSQFHQVSTQFYNQLPFCELISSSILEWDEAVDRKPLRYNAGFEEGTFKNAVEKMFLEFTVKILQKQQVRVDAL
jgi:hypothetical protein